MAIDSCACHAPQVGLDVSLDHFLIFVACLTSLVWLGTAFGIAVGATANSFQEAQQAIAPTLVPLILFSGYLIPYDQIPSYFKFLYNISFFQYALAILLTNQFHGLSFTDCPPSDLMDQIGTGLGSHSNCSEVEQTVVECMTPWLLRHPKHGEEILETCAAPYVRCYKTGNDFLDFMHIDPDSLGTNFLIIWIYLLIVVVVGFLQLRVAASRSI